MKNKKLNILFQGLKSVNDQLVKTQNAPNQQSTIKITTNQTQTPTIVTAIQIRKFQEIFPDVKLAQVIQDFRQYTTLPSQLLGKRSSRIVISKSSRYCLKIIQEDDINQIQAKIQPLMQRFQNNKTNCLVNIYYIFVIDYAIMGVKMIDRYIVMPNIRANFEKCIKTFDIKGHLQARVIDHQDFLDFKFGKDQNFIQSQELKMIKKKTEIKVLEKFIQEINQNIQFLNKYGILDYSLLFSLEIKPQMNDVQQKQIEKKACQEMRIDNETVVKWMIIDYFQIYNEKKKFENKFKSIFYKTVSSVQPQIYSKRLLDFLKKYLLG